jgi:tetratricopeptide (TPR) repeat protein
MPKAKSTYTLPSFTNHQHLYDPNDLFVIAGWSNMGIALFYQGRFDEAEYYHRHVYQERARLLGHNHHETIKSKAYIAINEMGRSTEAETMYLEALSLSQAFIGPTHPDTLKTYHNLATALYDQGRYKDADEAITAALPFMRSTYGSDHAEYLEALEFRAIILHCLELYSAALEVVSLVYGRRLIVLGYRHESTQKAYLHLKDLAENCKEEEHAITIVV